MPSEGQLVISTEDQLVAIEVLDDRFRLVDRGFGKLQITVPAGLYVVRCDLAGPEGEHIVKVKPEATEAVRFGRQKLPSAVPVPGTESCHEYYAYAASDWSRREPERIGRGARLVLFACHEDRPYLEP